jgi:CTP-dependent riboflavin kinase
MPTYIPWLIPGTLNVALKADKPKIHYNQTIETNYGYPARIADCKINGLDAHIILPPLGPKSNTGGLPRFVEIGATFHIREQFNLKNGDSVIIEFETGL